MTESAEYKKAKASYGALVDHFTFYASYHSNKVNQWIHIIVSRKPWPIDVKWVVENGKGLVFSLRIIILTNVFRLFFRINRAYIWYTLYSFHGVEYSLFGTVQERY